MDVVKETKEKARKATSRGDGGGKSLARKVLVPLAASAASGATAYAARKAPSFFQEKVLPKLKELASDGGALDKAKKAVESAVPSAVGGAGQEATSPPRRAVSSRERAKRQRERAQNRRERKQALSKSR